MNQSSSLNSSSHQLMFNSSSEVEQSSSFSSGQFQQTCGQSTASQSQEIVETRENVTCFDSVQSVSSEQRQSLKVESSQTSEVQFSSADQKSSAEKLSSDHQIGLGGGESSFDVSSPYNLPPQVSARSLLSELEAPPSPLLINNDNASVNNSNTTTSSGGATPWAPATTSPDTRPELSLSSPPSQPLNLGSVVTPLGGLEQPSTNSPVSSSSGFQLQRPRQFQPSPATARRILPPSPASQSPQSPHKASPAPQKVSPAAPKRNSPSTSSSSDLTVQFGQQKEVKFNSVSSEQKGRVDNNNKSGATSSRDSKSKSKEAQSGQLAHAICNMTETLASFKASSSSSFSIFLVLNCILFAG